MIMIWSVWIDYNKKIITFRETFQAKQFFFENKEAGMKKIIELTSRGYRIG